MSGFWTRSRRFVVVLWSVTLVLEVLVFELARRTNDSWFLLLLGLLVAIPIVAADRTWGWFSRPRRKRWKRHDLDATLAAERERAGK